MSEIGKLWKGLSDDERSSCNLKPTKVRLIKEIEYGKLSIFVTLLQINFSYKMKYASFIENLIPEQRNTELIGSKHLKQTAVGSKGDEQLKSTGLQLILLCRLLLANAQC
jgi:upstream-binding transcription factor